MDAVDYLLKPFSLSRFVKACNKTFELYNFRGAAPAPDFFFLKTGYEQVKVFFEDILYLEAAGNYITFVLKDKTVLSRLTFNEATSILPPQKFVRTHRSFIVAINKIDKAERYQVIINKKSIPVSEAYSQELAAALKK
jgi:DNA-binding LytR/AlgR family response regulator